MSASLSLTGSSAHWSGIGGGWAARFSISFASLGGSLGAVSKRASSRLNLHAGELVEVRSEPEILATLDAEGRLDGLPFMPEMLQYCGQRFRVFKSAHKTCDTIEKTGGRRMRNAVHLAP
jgi:hypothetical protein